MRADAAPAPKVHVTIVTLDNHLSGAAERAAIALAQDGIAVHFHAAADFNDPAELARTHADIARGDIVLSTMLFLEDHIRAVLPQLQARREDCDAMLGLMSDGEVVRLTKLGGYRMDAPAKGPLALLKKLRGNSKPGASSGEKQMRMLKRLPKILRFIPGAAQDVRAYFLTLQYWLSGSDENFVQMVRALVDRYAAGDRAALKGTLKPVLPKEYPEVGVYHPALAGRMSEDDSALPVVAAPVATVGLLLLRSYVLGHDSAHYDGVIAAMEAKGVKVIPAFASGLDSRPAIERYFLKDGVSQIDALVSLTGFSLVGGPAYNDSSAASESSRAWTCPTSPHTRWSSRRFRPGAAAAKVCCRWKRRSWSRFRSSMVPPARRCSAAGRTAPRPPAPAAPTAASSHRAAWSARCVSAASVPRR